MDLIKVTESQKKALGIATILAILFGAYFLRSFFLLIVIAAIVAYLFYPVYSWLLVRLKRPGSAAALTMLITLLALIIPLSFVLILSAFQIESLISKIATEAQTLDFGNLGESIINSINEAVHSLGITSFQLTPELVGRQLSQLLSAVGDSILGFLTSSVGSIFGFITTLIIYIYVFMSMLRNNKHIIATAKLLNPLGDEVGDLYLQRIGAMTKAMVRGQFIIAIAQGITGAVLLYLAGLHTGFMFFALILTVFSIVPLGGGIIALPIAFVMLLTGNVLGALIVAIGHFLIVTNIDNILRPRLVPQEARLDSALTMLGVFAGIALFGFMGLVIGPVLMIIIVTTIQVYLEVYTQTDSIKKFKGGKLRRTLLGRLRNILPRVNRSET